MHAFPPLPSLPAPHPFRVGVTSFVHPADRLPNVQALAPFVDDIELLFLDSGPYAALPDRADIDTLAMLAAAHNLTYTVHLPIDKALGSPSATERDALLAYLLELVEVCRPLQPHGWILHLDGLKPTDPSARIRQWQEDVFPLLDRIVGQLERAERLCIENTDYPFEHCLPFVERFPVSLCLDLGHLWQQGYDWQAHVRRHLARTRIVHLYGAGPGTRHYSLATTPPALVREVLAALMGYTGVLTLETFGYDDTRSSLERLIECLN